MSILPSTWLLFAKQDRVKDLYRGFRSSQSEAVGSEVVLGLVILGCIAVALVLISWFLHWQQRRRCYCSPRQLFLSLCRAHHLRWKEYWWLWQLARQQQLADPARVFLEPERFETSRIPPSLRARASVLQSLRARLFHTEAKKPKKSARETAAAAPSPPAKVAFPQQPSPPSLDAPPWTAAPGTSPPIPPAENAPMP